MIPANAFLIDQAIKLDVPAMSVQFIMIEAGIKLLYPTSVANIQKNDQGLMNYPNPFSDLTSIQFQTSSNALVVLDVYDQTGRKISTLINGELPSGKHQVDFSGSLLPEGWYFYQLKVGNGSTTRKMVHKK
jgi:hypothetical protein